MTADPPPPPSEPGTGWPPRRTGVLVDMVDSTDPFGHSAPVPPRPGAGPQPGRAPRRPSAFLAGLGFGLGSALGAGLVRAVLGLVTLALLLYLLRRLAQPFIG